MTFAQKLRRLRQERGVTLRFVEGETRLSNAFLSQLETGKAQPSAHSLEALADFFGMSMDRLWRGDLSDVPNPSDPEDGP